MLPLPKTSKPFDKIGKIYNLKDINVILTAKETIPPKLHSTVADIPLNFAPEIT